VIDYDFSTLNDKEFENISIELISRDQEKRFERFKPGKDAGVDGRFYADDGKEEIVQCKHYLKTGYQGLVRILKNEEKAKVLKLNPKKYYFITSLPLSRKGKQEIKAIFYPYIRNENNIYGQEDLNDLLKNNSDIEEKYYKLWISSTTVLKRIFSNAIKGRSEFLLEDIEDKVKKYVMTENHQKALKKLDVSHVIIIAGEPGIGKTTLAEHLALKYVEQGFEFCVIENSLNEAESIFDTDRKQLFYFDDFLGSNYLEALEFHQDSHTVKFINRIKKEKNKRFILTSRTNIFNQSLLLSDTFVSSKIDKDEFIIKVDSLSEIEKAMILYNHIWHSELAEKYIDVLYKDKRYLEIIKHRSFNPRLIEFITDIDRLSNTTAIQYWQFIKERLDNPSDIWKNTFDRQSDEYIRNIVILVVLNGNKIEEKELIKSYETMNQRIKLHNPSHSSKDFESVVQSAVKYFLNRTKTYKKTIEYSLFNPSIADFIINRYKNTEQKLMQAFLSLGTLDSLKVLRDMSASKIISKQLTSKILVNLYEDFEVKGNKENIDYAIFLFSLLNSSSLKVSSDNELKKIKLFHRLLNQSYECSEFSFVKEFFDVLVPLLKKEVLHLKNYEFLISLIKKINEEIEYINSIIMFVRVMNIKDEDVTESLEALIHQYLVYELDYDISNIDVDEFEFEWNDGNVYLLDRRKISEYMDECLGNHVNKLEKTDKIYIDESTVQDNFNISSIEESLINSYIKSLDNVSVSSFSGQAVNYADNIDDLFER